MCMWCVCVCVCVHYADLDRRLEPGARSPLRWRDLMFWFRSIACLLQTEGQGPSRSLWESPRVRERAVNVLLEFSLVQPCVQPDCQRLPLFIPTARLPAFATLYPNSQNASVCHSLSQHPDCQRLPLFIPTAMPPLGTGLYRRVGFCCRGCLP